MRDALIKFEWFEQIKNAPEEVQKELFYRIIKYGVLEDEIKEDENDWAINNAWMNLKGHIDRMKVAHEASIENGKKNGRKLLADPQLVYDFCREHGKVSVNEIGVGLNLPQQPSAKGPYAYLYGNEGWKHRNEPGWVYRGSEIFPNSEKDFPKMIPNSEIDLENSFQKTIPKKKAFSEIF